MFTINKANAEEFQNIFMWDTFLLVCVRIYNFRLIDIS